MRASTGDPEEQVRYFEGALAPYLAEFRPRAGPGAPVATFRLDNHTYDRVDAELLYAHRCGTSGPRRYRRARQRLLEL